jgi:hypothetical protein
VTNAEDDADAIEAAMGEADVDFQDRADFLREASAIEAAGRLMVAVLAKFVEASGASYSCGVEMGTERVELAVGVELARDDALEAAFGRIARIARSDLKV